MKTWIVLAVSLSSAAAFAAQVVRVGVGTTFSCALFDDGSLKCWGDNEYGQLGLGDTGNRGDQAGSMGGALPVANLGQGVKVTDFALSGSHACAALSSHVTKCWGYNAEGQLGLGDTAARGGTTAQIGDALPVVNLGAGRSALQLSAGGDSSCALLDDHSIKCWGNNSSGQLGVGSTAILGAAANQMGDALPAVQLGTGRTALSVGMGDSFACALLDDHGVKCWGGNNSGQLGQGDTSNRGDAPNELGDSLKEIDLGPGRTALAISVGASHACALLDSGDLKCWGDNSSGELGLGDGNSRGGAQGQMGAALPAVNVEPGLAAGPISAGGASTCAVLKISGTLKCWGSNQSGELGLEDTRDRGASAGDVGVGLPFIDLGLFSRVLAVSIGPVHTCALLGDSSVRCWGANDAGQLGLGDTNSRGSQRGTMGSALPSVSLQ